jgi:hypothetical protein
MPSATALSTCSRFNKDMQALIDAGCDTCLAQYGFNSPHRAAGDM